MQHVWEPCKYCESKSFSLFAWHEDLAVGTAALFPSDFLNIYPHSHFLPLSGRTFPQGRGRIIKIENFCPQNGLWYNITKRRKA